MQLKAMAGTLAALALGSSLLVATAPAAGARGPGLDKAPRAVVSQVVKDLSDINPAKCYVVYQARSNPSWASFYLTPNLPSDCAAYDGYTVIHKVKGVWTRVRLGGSGHRVCSDLKVHFAEQGVPASVFRDFKAARYCTPEG